MKNKIVTIGEIRRQSLLKIHKIYKNKVSLKAFKVLFVIYILFMIWELYLGNFRSPGYAGYNLIPFKTILGYLVNMRYYSTWIIIVNIVGNIIVFIPMGFFISFFLRDKASLIRVILISVAVLVPAELLQAFFKVGSFDIDDIILNVLGSILGFMAYKIF